MTEHIDTYLDAWAPVKATRWTGLCFVLRSRDRPLERLRFGAGHLPAPFPSGRAVSRSRPETSVSTTPNQAE